ncbi:MAG: hypothetical protein GY913_04325 [Proteobacteria bacterium]|nr:hypothetical protein [Pseudomonadota bacterium]MCP4916127.1 hypothetical protein [Pseudomonadota bacterium]
MRHALGLLCLLVGCRAESVALDGPLRARLSPDGLVVQHAGDQLGVATVACGSSPLDGAALHVAPDRLELLHGELTEWWAATDVGLEHGWTLRAPCSGGSSLDLRLDGELVSIDASGLGATLAGSEGASGATKA